MQKTNSIIVLVLLSLGLGLQAQEGGNGEKSKPVYKAPSGKVYPAHWGAPPRRQTRDLRVLPGGYGRGSGTLARWIQEQLDKDAKSTGAKPKSLPARPVPVPPIAVEPVAPRPVAPPVFDPNAKAREQAKVDTAKVKEGIQAWEAAKATCKGHYRYKVGFESWVGFGHETTIVVAHNKVIERRYRTFNRRRPIAPARPGGAAPPQPEGKSWVEKGKTIGTHKQGAPAKTLDECYQVALETAQKPLKEFERRYIRSDKQGLLVSCFIVDRRIADDAPRNGLVLSSIQLGRAHEGGAAAAPPVVGGGDCALCRTEAHQLHLGQAENGQTITVKQGSTLKVKLKGNPTTGFTWNNATRGHGLKLLGEITHQAGGRALGAPGMSTATFQALKTGTSELVLQYHRVFENKPPLNTVKIHVVVTEDGRASTVPAVNKTQARMAELEKEIARMKDFARRARFTPEGLKAHKAKLATLENERAQLKRGKVGVPTFEEWVKGGKTIPAGKVFIGGSPWFNEGIGKRRTAEEVYQMLYGK